jgi:hypothetical protein
MHHKDQTFLTKTLELFETELVYKTSETSHRIKCVVSDPPKISLAKLKQIQMIKPCKININVRDREFSFDFYKEGITPSRKRAREPDKVKHPFDIKVHPDDQKVVDTALDILCSHPNLCVFRASVKKGDKYNLELHMVESIPYSIVETIMSSLSTFVSNIDFDFPNQRINIFVKRNDNL